MKKPKATAKKKVNTTVICLSKALSAPSRISMKNGEIVVTKTGEKAVFSSSIFPDGTPVLVISREHFAGFLRRAALEQNLCDDSSTG